MRRIDVIALLDQRFPPSLAEEGDPTGLQVGPLDAPCRRVLVVVDLELGHLDRLGGMDLVITHHPLIYRPLRRVEPCTPLGQKLRALLTESTACYAVHTPYDSALGGMGEQLAGAIGLQATRPLWTRGRLFKLVTFVPTEDVDAVADALFAAGAGEIGRYSRCSFRTEGTGTFLPGEGTSPHIGRPGSEEHAAEVRLETVVPEEARVRVVEALVRAHPYEEVAYDLYRMELKDGRHGPGRVGLLPSALPGEALARKMCALLGTDGPLEIYGDLQRPVRRVAVCGGAGGGVWEPARDAGAELLLTGEIGYHAGTEAAESGLAVVCFGHRESERPFVGHIATILGEAFSELEVLKE